MSLDTLSNVKTRLGISTTVDDALLNLLRDTADAFIAQYCGRDFEAGTFTEKHEGRAPAVHLRNYPVTAITSLRVDPNGDFGAETELAASDYVLDAARGLIWSRCGNFVAFAVSAQQAVRVIYTTSTLVPNDVKQAYAELVGHWYRHVKTMIAAQYQNVTQQTFGDATAIFAKGQIAGLPLPEDFAVLLAPYREVPV